MSPESNSRSYRSSCILTDVLQMYCTWRCCQIVYENPHLNATSHCWSQYLRIIASSERSQTASVVSILSIRVWHGWMGPIWVNECDCTFSILRKLRHAFDISNFSYHKLLQTISTVSYQDFRSFSFSESPNR